MRRLKTIKLKDLEKKAEKAGRVLCLLRWLKHKEQKVCLTCGKPFEGLRWGKYCSNACRVKFQRLRKKGLVCVDQPQHHLLGGEHNEKAL